MNTHQHTNTKSIQDLKLIRLECQKMAKSRAKISAGIAVIPFPFLDAAIDVAMLSQLLPEISSRFGLEYQQSNSQNLKEKIMHVGGLIAARGVVNKTVQGFGGRFIGKQVSKFVPFGGQIVAGTLGYMIFKKIAFDHIEECYQAAQKLNTTEQHS